MREASTRARIGVAAVLCAAASSCALITGISDLKRVDCVGSCAEQEAGSSDAAADSGPPAGDGSVDATFQDATGMVAVRRIRCGVPGPAPPYTDSNGQTWSGDRDFDVGSVVGNNDAIQGTNDPALYHAERFADRTTFPAGFKYTFDNIPNGSYLVRLHFVEASSATVFAQGQRRFDVSFNGTKVLTELDIFAEAGGKDRALVKALPVNVSGSSLVLQFSPGTVQNPKVNAIEVLKNP